MEIDTNTLAIIGVGLALAGLILRQGSRLDHRIDGLRTQINGLHDQISDWRERLARIEGILTRQTASAEEALRAQG